MDPSPRGHGGDEALAAAVLMTWMETRSRLREAAAAHLRQRGIEVIEPPGIAFTSSWEPGEWLLERDRLLEDHDAGAGANALTNLKRRKYAGQAEPTGRGTHQPALRRRE